MLTLAQLPLTPETMILLGGAAAAITTLLAPVVYAVRKIDHIDRQFHELRGQLLALAKTQQETWSLKDQVIWGLRFQIANPGIAVPDAGTIAKLHRPPIVGDE